MYSINNIDNGTAHLKQETFKVDSDRAALIAIFGEETVNAMEGGQITIRWNRYGEMYSQLRQGITFRTGRLPEPPPDDEYYQKLFAE